MKKLDAVIIIVALITALAGIGMMASPHFLASSSVAMQERILSTLDYILKSGFGALLSLSGIRQTS